MTISGYLKRVNWKRMRDLTVIAIVVPFATIGMWFVDKMTYDINILTDVHYIYLAQINILIWILLFYILGLVYKKEK